MKTQGVVDLGYERRLQLPEGRSQPLDRDGADLFSLSLGGNTQTSTIGGHQNLEREHASGVAGQGYHCDHAAAQPLGDSIGPIVADHDSRPLLVGLTASDRIQINQPNFTTAHQDNPSEAVVSHISRSPDRSQSSQAAA